jgi:copper resistance protein B
MAIAERGGAAAGGGRRALAGAVLVLTGLVGLVVLARATPAAAQSPEHVEGEHEMMRWEPTLFLLSEVLEYAPTGDERPVRYDLLGWFGGAVNRLWAKAEGDQSTRSDDGVTELQLLYGRLISPYWDAQLGLRADFIYGGAEGHTRLSAALGLQGLAPGWFELEPTLFVSQDGDVSGNLTASYDLFVTQRLVVQGRGEIEGAVQDVPEFGVGSGLSVLDLGLRVRFEIWRELAPYVGLSWQRLFMDTADLARAADVPVQDLTVVAGLRLWY